MKRIFAYLLLLSLGLWPLLQGQQQTATPPTSDALTDSLITLKRYDEAAIRLFEQRRGDSLSGNWPDYQQRTIKLADVLSRQLKYEEVHALLDQSLGVFAKNNMGGHPFAAKLWSWHALTYARQDRFPEALASYESAIKIYEQNDYYGSEVGYAYKNAAQIYMRYSNNRKALEYFDAGLRRDTTGKQHASILSQTAATWLYLDSLDAARAAYQKALKTNTTDPAYQASILSTGAALAQRDGELQEAERLTRQALDIYFTLPTAKQNVLRSYASLADIAHKRGQPQIAEGFYRQAEAFSKEKYTGKSREIAILYLAWGEFYEKQGRADEALNLYQKAVVQVFPGFNDTLVTANPPLTAAYIESQAMFSLAKKGAALLKKTPLTAADRLNAADCFEGSFAIAALLRKTYGDDADKLSLAGENRGYQQLAARNLWALWLEQKDPAVLSRLFQLVEQTKAQALADAVRRQRALVLTNIPEELAKQEAFLRLNAADAALSLKKAELEASGKDSLMAVLKETAFRTARDYEVFLTSLEKKYPEFRQFSANDAVATPAQLSAQLPDTVTLLSYFDAGDRLLAISVSQRGVEGFEVVRDSAFDRQLLAFLKVLNDKAAQENAPAAYFQEAYLLGAALLPAQLLQRAKSLLIVPDGRLCYLPFEALLTARYEGSFARAPYLLRSHTVRYVWSAGLLTDAVRRRSAKGFLHVAPFVDTARDGLAPLPESRNEQPDNARVTALLGEQAQSAAFLAQAGRFRVVQLSTHAHAGGHATPGIEFFDRTLDLNEIYAQRIPASLVALSACETGTGEYAEGEGVLSLARAFAYAGAESLMASHWSVNERATAELFASFYDRLAKGQPRAEALRQAKLAWLNGAEADARKAPWYWAAITLSGADGPIDLQDNTMWWWIAGLASLVVLGLAWKSRRGL